MVSNRESSSAAVLKASCGLHWTLDVSMIVSTLQVGNSWQRLADGQSLAGSPSSSVPEFLADPFSCVPGLALPQLQ